MWYLKVELMSSSMVTRAVPAGPSQRPQVTRSLEGSHRETQSHHRNYITIITYLHLPNQEKEKQRNYVPTSKNKIDLISLPVTLS